MIISHIGCVIHLYVFRILGITECLLLDVMPFDCYVAICRPLLYTLIMNQCICLLLASIACLGGMTYTFSEATLTWQFPLCVINKLNHLWETAVLINITCDEKEANDLTPSVVCIFMLAVPIHLILASYASFGHTTLNNKSSEGRIKAFGTYLSHLFMIFQSYDPAISIYLLPSASFSRDQPKFMAVFYGVMSPTCNPFIYTLRKKGVKEALGKLVGAFTTPSEICRHKLKSFNI